MTWDPGQYRKFADERGRPFEDLVRRIPTAAPGRIVDLGCGPGDLTVSLLARWPDAEVEGVDSSPEMIREAEALGSGVRFRLGDVAAWSDPGADVIVSNACLQWVPAHRELVRRWAATLPADGCIAFQMPHNADSPAHRLLRELAASPRWAARLDGVLRRYDIVGEPEEYAALLQGAGLRPDVWETTYLHPLTGSDPVLEWVRGTALRPVLGTLDPAEAAEFEAAYAGVLREAYPAPAGVTLLGYRRLFAVGHRA